LWNPTFRKGREAWGTLFRGAGLEMRAARQGWGTGQKAKVGRLPHAILHSALKALVSSAALIFLAALCACGSSGTSSGSATTSPQPTYAGLWGAEFSLAPSQGGSQWLFFGADLVSEVSRERELSRGRIAAVRRGLYRLLHCRYQQWAGVALLRLFAPAGRSCSRHQWLERHHGGGGADDKCGVGLPWKRHVAIDKWLA
jgi:hypothetical protein